VAVAATLAAAETDDTDRVEAAVLSTTDQTSLTVKALTLQEMAI
jgi:hypothetical protein